MFRTLIYPSSGARNCAVELPRRSFCSQFIACWRFGAAVFEWCPCCRLKLQLLKPSRTKSPTRNEPRTKWPMMDILMSETCWVHKKWNKIASDIKLVFYSSTIPTLVFSFTLTVLWLQGRVTTKEPYFTLMFKPEMWCNFLCELQVTASTTCLFNLCVLLLKPTVN